MNYSKFSSWISNQIKVSKRLKPAVTIYLIFLMASSRTHTLTAAARFSDSSKSRFHHFLKNNADKAPIKNIYCKNQRIFGVGLANHLILLIPKFSVADEARKIWCGKYLFYDKKMLDLFDNYAN